MADHTRRSGADHPPLVSVIVPTYQHAPYIEACLNGILEQRTDFTVEILVGEDESTDGTREICQRIAAEHPDKVRLFLHSRKDAISIMGRPTGRANMLALMAAAKGKYAAWCEGDDYWTDPLKLQKQVDHLEQHPGDVLCFHAVGMEHLDGRITEDRITKVPAEYATQADLARKGNYIHTPSVVFRNILGTPPPELALSPIGDFFLWVVLAGHGNLYHMPEVMANYRLGGNWSATSRYHRVMNTVYCHAALHAWAKRMGHDELAAIMLQRIRRAIDEQRMNLQLADLARFGAYALEVRRSAQQHRRWMIMGKPVLQLKNSARKVYHRIKALARGQQGEP
ncbi:MAG TPA: glycosyltransferase family 2 protein [Flavobacteriales bacterium]|nr:glycosyltransferase family 2 protein [Flavobacteriales bacterium]